MPIYDYVCSACGHRLEVIHGVSEAGPHFCSACGAEGTMKKAFVPPAIHFKGSGWAKKDRSATAAPGKSAAPKKPADAGPTSSERAPGPGDGGTASTATAGKASDSTSGSSGSSGGGEGA